MALTTEEEAKVKKIITAYDNGKRLNELPVADSSNPFDLTTEVLDKSGESKQAGLAAMLPYAEDQCSYGVELDVTVSSSVLTRTGNMTLHKTLPIQSKMKGCLLSDEGKVIEYLNPTNWKAHKRDGSNGMVMVEIPAHWRRFYTNGNKRGVRISEYPIPGYHFVKKCYISAYEATIQRSTGKLASVVNTSTDYRGGNNQADWDALPKSQLGKPATSTSRINFRAAARKRGAGTQWNCMDYNAYITLAWLYYIEYGNLNCQLAFNAQKDSNGYAQGGLGNGVTTWDGTKWNNFNGYNPIIPCGTSDELGNASGEVAYTLEKAEGESSKVFTVPRYRGIENPFGHVWKWTDGVNIEVKTNSDGGTSKVYVCDDPSKYNDSNYTGYTLRGLAARAEGYAKEMIFGEFGDLIASVVGGGSTTYWCDYFYTNIGSNALRGVLFGGTTTSGDRAGFGYASSSHAPSYTYATVGSRLCFIPES